MKICILGNIPPPIGGAEVHTHLLGTGLKKLGHDVHILRWHRQYYFSSKGTEIITWCEKKSFVKDGLAIHPFLVASHDFVNMPQLDWEQNKILADIYSVRKRVPLRNLGLRNFVNTLHHWTSHYFSDFNFLLWKVRPDLYHVQDLQHCGPVLPQYRRLFRPLVITVHYGGVYDMDKWTRFKESIYAGLEKAAVLIAVCEDIKLKLAEMGVDPSKIRVIENGVDTKTFFPDGMPRQNRIVCVNRLVPKKGTELLIRAMPRVLSKSKICLDIIGSGPSIHRLRYLTSKLKLGRYVNFLGDIPHDRLPSYLNRASIFALPSYSEGLPLSLLEAMACELPVIATPVGGVPEVVKNGKNGVLIEPGDVAGLSEAVLHLLEDRTAAHRIAANARKTVCKRNNIEKIVAETESVYRELVF